MAFIQILAGNIITCLEPLLKCQCRFKFLGCGYRALERNILLIGLGLTVTEINKKSTETIIKNTKNVKMI